MDWREKRIQAAKQNLSPEVLGSIIDLTNLQPDATLSDIGNLCRDAHQIGANICVNGGRLHDVRNVIKAQGLTRVRKIAGVADFPLGAGGTYVKLDEARRHLDAGANEIDIVLNIGCIKGGIWKDVYHEMQEVARVIGKAGEALKIIQENCLLTKEEKVRATQLARLIAERFDVHVFAKTSTGMGKPKPPNESSGATPNDIALMEKQIHSARTKSRIGLKAAGGIRDLDTAVIMMLAGNCFTRTMEPRDNLHDYFRIGASAGKAIVEELKAFHASVTR